MAPVKISFNDHCATPPVYVAGSFTKWEAVEIDPVENDQAFYYEKTFDLAPGTYQYKFRLGTGDWWVCDSQAAKTSDAAGNENNEIVVEAEPIKTPAAVATAPIVNGDSQPKVSKAVEPSKVVAAPLIAPAAVSVAAPIKESVATSENGPTASPIAKTNGVHHSVTEDVNSTTANIPPQSPIKVNGVKPSFVPAVKEEPTKETSVSPKDAVVPTATEKTETPTPSSSAAKEPVSKDSSLSSIPAKEKVSSGQEPQPEKLSWFSRIFLCGGSRK